MYPRSVHALQSAALFVSPLQRSHEPSISQIRQAVAAARDAYGDPGCAALVAQEFGDHPEAAALRMRWARATVAVLGGQPVPRMRLGNLAAGPPAARSA